MFWYSILPIWKVKKMNNEQAIEQATYHAWFQHRDSDGWIAVAKKESGQFKQYHYKPEELAAELRIWLGEDVYFSQNTFFKPQRNIQNIRQLRSLYVDLDFYLFNYDLSWVLGKLEFEYYKEIIPEPNIIIFSGRGLVLIWLLEPVPYKALPLWQAVQNYFLDRLADLGEIQKLLMQHVYSGSQVVLIAKMVLRLKQNTDMNINIH